MQANISAKRNFSGSTRRRAKSERWKFVFVVESIAKLFTSDIQWKCQIPSSIVSIEWMWFSCGNRLNHVFESEMTDSSFHFISTHAAHFFSRSSEVSLSRENWIAVNKCWQHKTPSWLHGNISFRKIFSREKVSSAVNYLRNVLKQVPCRKKWSAFWKVSIAHNFHIQSIICSHCFSVKCLIEWF